MSEDDQNKLTNALRILELPLPIVGSPTSAQSDDKPTEQSPPFDDADMYAMLEGMSPNLDVLNVPNDGTFQPQASVPAPNPGPFENSRPHLSDFCGAEFSEWSWLALDPAIVDSAVTNDDMIDNLDFQLSRPQGQIDFTFAKDLSPQSHEQAAEVPVCEDESDADLITQLSTRFGSLHLAPDGQLRFFGAAANVHLLDERLQDRRICLLYTSPSPRD